MLTLNGYKVSKATVPVETLRKTLTVKPNVPKVFVSNPNAVPRYRVYKEVEDALYLPKHYGIAEYGANATVVAEYSDGVALQTLTVSASGSGKVVQTGYETDINGTELSIQKIEIQAKNGKVS